MPGQPVDPALARPVFVVNLGWHTRVAVRQADVPPAAWPESRALGDARYVEVGWGERRYYQTEEPTVLMALAAVWWRPAVLHVAAFDDVCVARAGVEVVRVDVTPAGLERLARFVSSFYERDAGGRPLATKPGYDPVSSFYLATGRYHVMSTSNTWVARALREAGADVTPAAAIFARDLMRQLEPIAAAPRPCGP